MAPADNAAHQDRLALGSLNPDEPITRRSLEFTERFVAFCKDHELPEREQEVLLETLRGYTVDSVAERLGLSRETVKTYLSRIYSRAGVGGRQELLAALDKPEQDCDERPSI